jgi:hypothetical protein
MTAQNPSVMIANVLNHLPLALKESINDKNAQKNQNLKCIKHQQLL